MSPKPEPDKFVGGLMRTAFTHPISPFPKVFVDGEEFELRYTPRSTYFIETSGQIGDKHLTDWLAEQFQAKHAESAIMIMMGSMLGHEVQVNGKTKWKPLPITGIELSERCTLEEWDAIGRSYADVMGKAVEAMTAALARLREKTEPTTETASLDQAVVIN